MVVQVERPSNSSAPANISDPRSIMSSHLGGRHDALGSGRPPSLA
jgi:hypothetical protein